MYYRSFCLPKDLYIFPVSAACIIYFRTRVNRLGFNNLLKHMKRSSGPGRPDKAFLVKYAKFYKALSFFLIRIFKDKNPCMIRSLVLYDLCKKNDIGAVLRTGVRKDNRGLAGHSWVEVAGEPVGEDKGFLNHFTVIYEV
jgi:hypothetical protein